MLSHPVEILLYIYSPHCSLLAMKPISKQCRWMQSLLYPLETSFGWWNGLRSRGWGLCCSLVEYLPSMWEASVPALHKEVWTRSLLGKHALNRYAHWMPEGGHTAIMTGGSNVGREEGGCWTEPLFFIFLLILFPLDSHYVIKRNLFASATIFPIILITSKLCCLLIVF